jgi:DNA-binding beta-propeller fold protein YncE
LFNSGGTYVSEYRSFARSTSNGSFDTPSDIAIDSSGSIYVADEYNNRVQKFASDFTYVTKWSVPTFTGMHGIAARGSDPIPFTPQVWKITVR